MKTFKFGFGAWLILCIMFISNAGAQVQTARYVSMITNTHAYYEYLPQGYPEAGAKYPLLLFFHGSGETGPGTSTSLPAVLRNGPPKLINNGTFPISFTVNNNTFKFIVISPQFVVWPTEEDTDSVINYLINHYPIDINRIYFTGLSMGGGTVWNYSGNNINHAKRLAGIIPVCGAGYPYPSHAATMAAANLPVWGLHNQNDPTVPSFYTNDYVNLINSANPPPSPLAKKTIFPVSGHDAWTQAYDPNYRENGMNVYEYILQFKRSFGVLPVTGLIFNAATASNKQVNLQWTTLSEIDNPDFKVLRSGDGVNFSGIATIASTAINGAGARYSYTDLNPLPGINYYKLEMQESAGRKTYSDVKRVQLERTAGIVVYPNPARHVINISSSQVFSNASLVVNNASGQVVQKSTINGSGNVSINISLLLPGTYYGEINDKISGKQKFQFVKN